MHTEHPDPEAEILWMRQPGIKLHSHGTWTLLRYVWGISRMLRSYITLELLETFLKNSGANRGISRINVIIFYSDYQFRILSSSFER